MERLDVTCQGLYVIPQPLPGAIAVFAPGDGAEYGHIEVVQDDGTTRRPEPGEILTSEGLRRPPVPGAILGSGGWVVQDGWKGNRA